jgi:peptidoglycan/xylan/chitin deacetylase (PgdA/CDA1 family)
LVDKVAVVTFDDGYEDNYEYALPILDECEIPATVFLTTGFVNGELDITQEHVAYRGLKSLTWEHVAQMKGSRISFGAHTHTHPMLSKITRKEVEEELSKCKEILEKRLMEPVDMFAYPFGWRGSFDDHIKKNLRGCGFTLACSTIWGSDNRNTDILALRRIRIDAVDTLKDFRQKVNGCWDFVRLFQVGK